MNEFESKYEDLGLLGTGSYGDVHLCKARDTGRLLACKILIIEEDPDEEDPDESNANEIEGEILVMRALPKHPNLVTFLEALKGPKEYCLVMEMCEGSTILDILKKDGPFKDEQKASLVMRQMCEGIMACHESGVVHRDLKIDNLIFDGERLKIIDFGLSMFTADGNDPDGLKRDDIFQAGIVMYNLAYGDTENEVEDDEDLVKKEIQAGDQGFKKVSGEAADLLRKMLDKDAWKGFGARDVLVHPWIQLQP